MLEHLEQQKSLTTNQWKIFAAATIGDMLDFFDFLPDRLRSGIHRNGWNLTYGQSGAILLSSGISAPLGSLFYGWLADKIGRRKVMILTVLNFSIATGLMALTPEHGWVFLVGVPVLGRIRRHRPLYRRHAVVQEFVPASQARLDHRGDHHDVAGGVLLGALLGQYARALCRLARSVRDRAAAGGIEPVDPRLGAGIAALADRVGRLEEARRSLAWALMVDPREIQLPAVAPPVEPRRLARAVQVSAQRRGRLPGRFERDRHQSGSSYGR